MARVLIAGFGYVGAELGRRLVDAAHSVWGLSRRPAVASSGVVPISADLGVRRSLADLPPDLDYVFYMASPGGRGDAFYRTAYVLGLSNLLDELAAQGQSPKRVFFVSSTSVLAQQRGEWVDELSEAAPTHYTGQRLREAEQLLAESVFASTTVRFGGIYGPRRTRLIESVRSGNAVYRRGKKIWTNRIHRDDCAGMLQHLMGHQPLESLYLGVDCEPALRVDVLRWLAGTLGAPEPRVVAANDPTLSAPRTNKRCRNDRLLATGYTFTYPTYREGYSAVIAGRD